MFICTKAPPEKDLEWDDADVEGQFRFLQRLWQLVESAAATLTNRSASVSMEQSRFLRNSADEQEVRRAVHTAIAEIGERSRRFSGPTLPYPN